MAPNVNAAQAKTENNYKPGVTKPQEFDFASINIGEYMLSNDEQKTDFLRARLAQVREHNQPIYEEIANGKEDIKEAKREVNYLRRLYRDADTEVEKAALKKQLSAGKQELWGYIRHNIRLAFSLEKA